MNKLMKAALAATLVAGGGSAAQADLTYQGAVGLPLNPTAQIPLPGGVRIQGDYFDVDNGNEYYGVHAAGRVGGRFELNGGYSKLNAPGGDNGFTIGAKALLTRESDPAGVRIAVGAGHDSALFSNTHVYLVGTKAFGAGDRPITGHLGLRYDDYNDLNTDKVSVYAGVEVPLTREGNFHFVGELQSKNITGGNTPYSASVRFRPAGSPFSGSLGWQRQGLGGPGFFGQIGYTFDTNNN